MRGPKPLAVLLSLTAGVLAGCGPATDDAKPASSTSSAAASSSAPAKRLTAYDPPQWFDARNRVLLPEAATKGRTNLAGQIRGGGEHLPVLLHETRAFVASPTGVQVIDLTDGSVLGEESARGEALREDSDGFILPPVLAGNEVLVPFLLTTPASGTHTAGAMVELVAISTAPPYKAAWRTTVKLPEWTFQSSGKVKVAAVGADGGTAVVTVTGDDNAVSYGIDTASHALRWTQPGLEAVHTGTGMTVGLFHIEPLTYVPLGVDLTTGTEKWRGEKIYAARMEAAAAGTVRITGPQVGENGDQLLDVATGKARATMPPGLRSASCTYDRAATLVCTPGFAVVGVDAATGKQLWALKDGEAGRTPPTVTAVWHGRIYGRAVGGPVVLDARTGADMPTKPEAAPLLVTEYTGLVLDDRRLYSYPVGG
ncbi:PQQ-like beta-propeller repeat protein (plasmid) [Streptomyces yangpuensis]|uniref:PQQ-like beta-propeller repeat protein n=1 Tax=Streptomyces yangpuensis TaxID=1648182 RepID=A0ABY5Q7A4_9ACTN|nr:PQQ-like beta-propeller repeat protein [Streptomyces yangpuensis]UUY52321.1 PQQ-like beta-propeller repeat protein [Streptomyces yangpuensis]